VGGVGGIPIHSAASAALGQQIALAGPRRLSRFL
jgi:hypothetical protein